MLPLIYSWLWSWQPCINQTQPPKSVVMVGLYHKILLTQPWFLQIKYYFILPKVDKPYWFYLKLETWAPKTWAQAHRTIYLDERTMGIKTTTQDIPQQQYPGPCFVPMFWELGKENWIWCDEANFNIKVIYMLSPTTIKSYILKKKRFKKYIFL